MTSKATLPEPISITPRDEPMSVAADQLGKYAFGALFAPGKNHVDLGGSDTLQELFSQEGYTSQNIQDVRQAMDDDGLGHTDIITIYDTLSYTDSPNKLLHQAKKLLSKEGILVFSVPAFSTDAAADYWTSHSPDLRTHFTHDKLSRVMADVFGSDRFVFFPVTVQGAVRYWGIATSHAITPTEKKCIKVLAAAGVPEDSAHAYLALFYYNQTAQFAASKLCQERHASKWTEEQNMLASFYRHFQQGDYEQALRAAQESTNTPPLTNGVFWQALHWAEARLAQARFVTMRTESEAEIMELRERNFRLRDELHSLKNARLLGKIIKARRFVGDKILPTVKSAPKSLVRLPVYYAKEAVIAVIPKETTKAIVRWKGDMRQKIAGRLDEINSRYVQQRTISVEPLPDGQPLVTVVIPFYNRADTIDATMQSLVEQTYRRFEVVVVDDGSTDEASRESWASLSERYPTLTITLLRQENAGVAAARNYGISHARGRYVCCLDSDDMLDPTYIEKCALVLETHPEYSLVTTGRRDFGVINTVPELAPYHPKKLFTDNMVTTAAMFTKTAWQRSSGYATGIGYEDWDYWLTLAEQGDWGVSIAQPLFQYRVAMQSRFVEDKDLHWSTLKQIRARHPGYAKRIQKLQQEKAQVRTTVEAASAFVNFGVTESGRKTEKPAVLIAIPWMTFGGAETLLYNYCRQIKDTYSLSFVTGLESKNEWEYKFAEVSQDIFHLPQLFSDPELYIEFLSYFIRSRDIALLHIVHTGFVFNLLPELKRRHPQLKVVVTMFNDRVEEYVRGVVDTRSHIDELTVDSRLVAESYGKKLGEELPIRIIPNGVDCYKEFNPVLYDRAATRAELALTDTETAVFFIGRLSEEKNPDVFLAAARMAAKKAALQGARFFMIGDGPMREEIEIALLKEKLPSFTYLGYQTDIAKYLSAADIFVLPSSIEGFPLSILEAMAMGVAVIASRVGAVPDVIVDGEHGYTIQPGSVQEIVHALERLLESGVLESIRKTNRQAVEQHYSTKLLGTRYDQLYKETLL